MEEVPHLLPDDPGGRTLSDIVGSILSALAAIFPFLRLQQHQFATVLIKSSVVILGIRDCGYPWQFSLITSLLMVLFFCLFANYYVQEYRRKKRAEKSSKKED